MARILITSGPTRQYLDPVRYLTNASSGKMGSSLARAALAGGHEVTVVSGPVEVHYPEGCRVIPVVTTQEMIAACERVFPDVDGAIAAAAPCDYQPTSFSEQKIAKSGEPLTVQFTETPDILAALGKVGKGQWLVGFALETDSPTLKALDKMRRKNCDLMVLNGPAAIHADVTQVQVLSRAGDVVASFAGDKNRVAEELLELIERTLIRK